MGTVTINCKISLSKKLRAILKDNEEASLVLNGVVVGGKGGGRLSLTGVEDDVYSDISEIGETSIQLIPIDYADETPNGDSIPQGAIFSTLPIRGESSPVVDRMAAVHAPEVGEESHAVVAKKDIKTPKEFGTIEDSDCKKWISNMEELIEAVSKAKGKRSDIDPDMAHNERERALLLELKEKDEAIDRPAWIINNAGGALIINDLDITLPIDSPYDLSNISARRVIMSGDLKGLIKGGYVRFLSPSEKDSFLMSKTKEDVSVGLPVFDSPEQAEAYMASGGRGNPVIDDENSMEIGGNDDLSPTDEESMIMDLTNGMVGGGAVSSAQGTRYTVHGSSPRPNSRPQVSNVAPRNTSDGSKVSPIRKLS